MDEVLHTHSPFSPAKWPTRQRRMPRPYLNSKKLITRVTIRHASIVQNGHTVILHTCRQLGSRFFWPLECGLLRARSSPPFRARARVLRLRPCMIIVAANLSRKFLT